MRDIKASWRLDVAALDPLCVLSPVLAEPVLSLVLAELVLAELVLTEFALSEVVLEALVAGDFVTADPVDNVYDPSSRPLVFDVASLWSKGLRSIFRPPETVLRCVLPPAWRADALSLSLLTLLSLPLATRCVARLAPLALLSIF